MVEKPRRSRRPRRKSRHCGVSAARSPWTKSSRVPPSRQGPLLRFSKAGSTHRPRPSRSILRNASAMDRRRRRQDRGSIPKFLPRPVRNRIDRGRTTFVEEGFPSGRGRMDASKLLLTVTCRRVQLVLGISSLEDATRPHDVEAFLPEGMAFTGMLRGRGGRSNRGYSRQPREWEDLEGRRSGLRVDDRSLRQEILFGMSCRQQGEGELSSRFGARESVCRAGRARGVEPGC